MSNDIKVLAVANLITWYSLLDPIMRLKDGCFA